MIFLNEPSQKTILTLSKTCDPIRSIRRIRSFGFKNAIIAGGALRDLYFQEPITAYDIFLWDPDENTTEQYSFNKDDVNRTINNVLIAKLMNIPIVEIDDMFGGSYIEPIDFDMEESFHDTGNESSPISQGWYISHGMVSYQLLFLKKDPLEFFEKDFDLGICKAYCDGTKIRYTNEFLNDVKNQTITIRDCGLTQEHFDYLLENHIERIKLKYPNFRVQIHPNNQKFVNDDNQYLIA